MDIFDIKIIQIGKYILSFGGIILILSILGNIYLLIRGAKETRQKIDNANEEIIGILKRNIYDEYIPQISLVYDIIDETAKKYRLKKNKLHDAKNFLSSIEKDIMDNPVASREKKDKLIGLIENEKKFITLERRISGISILWQAIKSLRSRGELEATKKEEEIKVEIPQKAIEIPPKKRLLFSDNFEKIIGWHDYKAGKIIQSDEKFHSGKFSLKKDLSGDPDGGFKEIGKRLSFGELKEIIFTGWIYRPLVPSTSLGDRLSIEDADFCGYGFCVNHSNNTVWIERRDNAKPAVISPIVPMPHIGLLKDKWYYFEFNMKNEGKFKFSIFDEEKKQLIYMSSFIDNGYLFFTQIAVHGGFPYYIDDIRIETII